MTEEEKKPKDPVVASTSPPPTRPPAAPPPKPAVTAQPIVPVKTGPSLTRRAFLAGAVGASGLLAAAALAGGVAPGILSPLVPTGVQTVNIADPAALEQKYENDATSGTPQNIGDYSSFFYYPYDSSVSPYYKNVVVRLPDAAVATSRSNILTVQFPNNPALKETGRFVAYNTTCVHLRCLVNPGYGSNEYRLLCPCHGSQYRLADGVPVAGPAFELGLKPLPQIQLKIDSSTGLIQATLFNGVPGIGRDHDLS